MKKKLKLPDYSDTLLSIYFEHEFNRFFQTAPSEYIFPPVSSHQAH